MANPDVSILIINYNTFELTCNCIQNIFDFTNGVSIEVILVDNASTEVDPDSFVRKFPQIKLIKSPVNGGFAAGNNLGIDAATGDYILLLNSDALLRNNAVLILKEFLKDHPEVAAVTGRLEYPDGRAQHNCQRFPSIRYKLFELFRLQKLLPKSIGGKILLGSFFDHKEVAFPDWIWGTCFMFPKRILTELPGVKLADDFFMYGEDVQWCLEFRRLGYGVAFDPDARILHLMGKSGARKEKMMVENEEKLMKKYYSPIHRWCLNVLDRLLSVSIGNIKRSSTGLS